MRIITVIVIIIFLLLMPSGYYGFRQMTDLPQWYNEEENARECAHLVMQSQKLRQQIAHGKIPVELSNDDLSGLILSEITRFSKKDDGQPIKGIQTQIYPDHILIDLILNVHALDTGRLDKDLSKRIHQLQTWLPRSSLQQLPLKLRLIPERDGALIRWHKDSFLKIGALRFPLNKVSSLARHFPVVDFELAENRVLLK